MPAGLQSAARRMPDVVTPTLAAADAAIVPQGINCQQFDYSYLASVAEFSVATIQYYFSCILRFRIKKNALFGDVRIVAMD